MNDTPPNHATGDTPSDQLPWPMMLAVAVILATALWYLMSMHDMAPATATTAHPTTPAPNSSAAPQASAPISGDASPAEIPNSVSLASPLPRADLAAAIERAKAERKLAPPAPPQGQASWQNMSPQDAAKVFADAVKANEQTSGASPFRHE